MKHQNVDAFRVSVISRLAVRLLMVLRNANYFLSFIRRKNSHDIPLIGDVSDN